VTRSEWDPTDQEGDALIGSARSRMDLVLVELILLR